jgi:hypothetical protein
MSVHINSSFPNFNQQFFRKTLNSIVRVPTSTVSTLMTQLKSQGLPMQGGNIESKIISFIKMGQQWLNQDDLLLIQQIASIHIKEDESKNEMEVAIHSFKELMSYRLSQQESLPLLLNVQDVESLKEMLAQENWSDAQFVSNFASALQLIPKAQRTDSMLVLCMLFNPLTEKNLREELLDILNSLAADDRAPFAQLAVDQLVDTESVTQRHQFIIFLAKMYKDAKKGGSPFKELSQYCEKYSSISLPKVLELLGQAVKKAPQESFGAAASSGTQVSPFKKKTEQKIKSQSLVCIEEMQVLLNSLSQEKRIALINFVANHLEGIEETQVLAISKKMIISIFPTCFNEAIELFSKINAKNKLTLIENILTSLHKYSDPELYHLMLSILEYLFAQGIAQEEVVRALHTWERLSQEQQNKAFHSMGLLFDQSYQLWQILFFMTYAEPSKEAWSDYVDDLTAILLATSLKDVFFWSDLFKETSKETRAQILKDIENFPMEGREELMAEVMQNFKRLEKEMVIPDANDRLNMLHMIIEGSF